MVKQEKFKIANLIKEFIIRLDSNLVNFPKKEIELKSKIKKEHYLYNQGNIELINMISVIQSYENLIKKQIWY